MAPTFTQKNPGDPLYLLQATFAPPMDAYTIAFWPGPNQSGLPRSLDLAQTWPLGTGAYLFLGSAPENQATFAAALAWYQQDPAYPGARFFWIANPNDSPGQWRTSRIVLSGQFTSVPSQFPLRDVTLFLGAGCTAALNTAQDRIVFTPPAGTAYLTAMNGAAALPNVGATVTLSFAGSAAGCWQFDLTLDNSGSVHPPDLDRLDVGCRYFADDTRWPGFDRLVSWRYPVFDPSSAASLPLAVSLDPLWPFVPDRTYFGLIPSGSTVGPTLTSYFVTNMGYRVTLTPTMPTDGNPDNVPRFVLAERALTNPSRPSDPAYLVPAGLFTLGVLSDTTSVVREAAVGNGAMPRLLCGIAGVEYVGLTGLTGDLLYFFPGRAAYAPGYPAGGTGVAPLSTVATTAWAYVVDAQGNGLTYYAQPNQSPLFQATGNPAFLSYLEMSAGTLPGHVSTTGQTPTLFPMVAFGGLQASSYADYLQVEAQVLSPTRRQIVYQLAKTVGALVPTRQANGTAAQVTAATTTAGTPQGLLATFDPAMTLTLAQTGGGRQQLQLGGVSGPLLAAIQSNQLFLVISSKTDLQQYATLFGSQLTITTDSDDVWRFDVFDGWDQHGTILIFKFSNKPLADLAADTSTWVGGSTFNDSLSDAQARIQAIVADARTRVQTEPEFSYFVHTVLGDPGWNGLLVLNCDVPLTGLPDQIAGIAAGIDPAKFYAHHLGVTLTPLAVVHGAVALAGDSSLFGLIYYNDPADLVDNGSPYQFKVLSLKVVFLNSAMTSFASQIEMWVSQFFREPVESPDTGHGENTIVLNGIYQHQGGQGSYLFVNTEDTVFSATSHVLASVEVVKAQFVTVVPPDKVPSGGQAKSSLLLWGRLRFLDQPGFDLFSFGDEPGFSGGLSYSGLSVDLAYDPKNPETKTFTFDATQIAFDLATSAARATSLYAKFPLSLTGFVQATSDKTTPTSLGYLGVDAPLGQSSLAPPWFGLVFTLNLGSVGALAAQAGFTATLLAAWSPNADSASISIGLKLPGTSSGGGSTFSLQGVLKLKIRRIQFVVVNNTYILNLNNIALSVLMLTLPPGGQTNFLLFGDPSGQDNTTLGWYAGYVKNPKKPGNTSARALPPGGAR